MTYTRSYIYLKKYPYGLHSEEGGITKARNKSLTGGGVIKWVSLAKIFHQIKDFEER